MFTCSNCDETYPSYGDCSGTCEGCRDKLEEQARIDAMSAEEYDTFMAAKDANSVWRAVNNLKTRVA